MPRLPRVSGAEAIRALERLGFSQVRHREVMWCLSVLDRTRSPVALFRYTLNWQPGRCVESLSRAPSKPRSLSISSKSPRRPPELVVLLQLFHHALNQLLRISQTLHDDLDVHYRLARPALALAIDAMLPDQRHGIGDRVHSHGQS